jgi:hypothetical protein
MWSQGGRKKSRPRIKTRAKEGQKATQGSTVGPPALGRTRRSTSLQGCRGRADATERINGGPASARRTRRSTSLQGRGGPRSLVAA